MNLLRTTLARECHFSIILHHRWKFLAVDIRYVYLIANFRPLSIRQMDSYLPNKSVLQATLLMMPTSECYLATSLV